MNNTPEQVARAINSSSPFNFSEYINRGFQLIGKQPGLFIGFTVVYLLIMMVCQIIPFAGTIGSIVASPCLVVGFYLAASRIERGESLEFGDFFKGFDHIGPLVLISVIQMVLMVVAIIPFGAAMFFSISMASPGDGMNMFPLILGLLFLIPIVYLAISWSLAPFLAVFHKMEAWPAMEASRKIVGNNWFSFFGFYLVVGLIVCAGALALGIGLIYTIPAGMCMYYAAFKDVVGLPEDNNEASFMDHLVD